VEAVVSADSLDMVERPRSILCAVVKESMILFKRFPYVGIDLRR
jgi:hypothetical protein